MPRPSEARDEDEDRTRGPGEAAALRRELEALRSLASRDRALLETVLDHSPHGVIVCDARGRLLLQNGAAKRFRAGAASADASDGWASDVARAALEHVQAVLGAAIDNARLFEAAQQAARAREEVVAVAAHALKNPPEAGRFALSRAPHALGPLVADALAVLRPIAAEKGVLLEAALGAMAAARPSCDRERLSQVVANLDVARRETGLGHGPRPLHREGRRGGSRRPHLGRVAPR